jgi:hypothetical protein
MPPRHFFLDCVPPVSAVISMNALALPRPPCCRLRVKQPSGRVRGVWKDFLKLRARLRHHDVFYRGRQASFLGSPTT